MDTLLLAANGKSKICWVTANQIARGENIVGRGFDKNNRGVRR